MANTGWPLCAPQGVAEVSFKGTWLLPGQAALAPFRTHQLEQCSQNLALKLVLKAILQEAHV